VFVSSFALILFGLAALAMAGNPLAPGFTQGGGAGKWDTANFPIEINMDRGNLGSLTNDVAVEMVGRSLIAWEEASVSGQGPSTLIDFAVGPQLPVNVSGQLFVTYFNSPPTGFNPILFDDAQGSGFELLGVDPDSVLGIAGPTRIDDNGIFTQGRAAINGKTAAVNLITTEGVVTHELGHFLGLGHSEVNGGFFFSGGNIPGVTGRPPVASIETMYPFVSGNINTLHFDDIVTAGRLYPNPAFQTQLGSIMGKMIDGAGQAMPGLVVAARDFAQPHHQATAVIVGAWENALGTPADAYNSFIIRGLTASDYTLNTQDAILGAYSSPLTSAGFPDSELLDLYAGGDEFYNVPESIYERGTFSTKLTLAANSTIEGLSFYANRFVTTATTNEIAEAEPNDSRQTSQDAGFFGFRVTGRVQAGDSASNVGSDDFYEDFYKFTFSGEEVPLRFVLRQTGGNPADLDFQVFLSNLQFIGGGLSTAEPEKAVFYGTVDEKEPVTLIVGVSLYDVNPASGPIDYVLEIGRATANTPTPPSAVAVR